MKTSPEIHTPLLSLFRLVNGRFYGADIPTRAITTMYQTSTSYNYSNSQPNYSTTQHTITSYPLTPPHPRPQRAARHHNKLVHYTTSLERP
ncbi:hypothetical protein E2C01_024161 [Portunus trituberculatus]|uniref:Uncharacterized protein n=1 Tax=Portunus trituberculatus TaxID=210409 RepID=A0A5B7E9L6_PORTR|nr:hypothetical protein [Portunus trituberculatus]